MNVTVAIHQLAPAVPTIHDGMADAVVGEREPVITRAPLRLTSQDVIWIAAVAPSTYLDKCYSQMFEDAIRTTCLTSHQLSTCTVNELYISRACIRERHLFPWLATDCMLVTTFLAPTVQRKGLRMHELCLPRRCRSVSSLPLVFLGWCWSQDQQSCSSSCSNDLLLQHFSRSESSTNAILEKWFLWSFSIPVVSELLTVSTLTTLRLHVSAILSRSPGLP